MKTTIAIIIVIVLAVGGYFFFTTRSQAPVQNPETTGTDTSAPLETTNPQATTTTPEVSTASSKTVTISYDGNAFSPASVTVKKGDTVKFVNTSGAPMWVASDPHPAHTAYSGTTKDQHCPDANATGFDQCGPGTSFSYTFQKVGTWGFHNHAHASNKGTVIVTE